MEQINDYLERATPSQQAHLRRIYAIIKRLAPNAEESISYGMPAFKVNGKPLVYFAAFKDHMSLFPAGDQTVDEIEGLRRFRTSKGTLQFTGDDPISDELVEQLIRHRLARAQGENKVY